MAWLVRNSGDKPRPWRGGRSSLKTVKSFCQAFRFGSIVLSLHHNHQDFLCEQENQPSNERHGGPMMRAGRQNSSESLRFSLPF